MRVSGNAITRANRLSASTFTVVAPAAYFYRFTCTSFVPENGQKSAVNVEEFTLNEDVVKADQEANRKWVALGEKLTELKKAKDYGGLLETVERDGFRLLNELGADASPVCCEAMLLMEKAAASQQKALMLADTSECVTEEVINLLNGALETARSAERYHSTNPIPDEVSLGEIREFIGFIQIDLHQMANGQWATEAREQFEKLLRWIDVDSNKAMPFVRVSARAQRRNVLTGLGLAKFYQGTEANSAAPVFQRNTTNKGIVNEALDHLIASLTDHLEESDYRMAHKTLLAVTKCFFVLNDGNQASASAAKLHRLCRRYNQDDDASRAEALEKEIVKTLQ